MKMEVVALVQTKNTKYARLRRFGYNPGGSMSNLDVKNSERNFKIGDVVEVSFQLVSKTPAVTEVAAPSAGAVTAPNLTE